MKTWHIINSSDGNDEFEVEANTLEDAALEALKELGWGIYTETKQDEDDIDDGQR